MLKRNMGSITVIVYIRCWPFQYIVKSTLLPIDNKNGALQSRIDEL